MNKEMNKETNTLPRFAFLPKPNSISTSEDVILMRAYDFGKECWSEKAVPDSQYITNKLDGFYLFSMKELEKDNWREPTQDEISQFALDAIHTYRSTEKARELLSSLKKALN